MVLNYIKIAVRNIQRNVVYSFINIFGLAVGLTCTTLILLWVKDELSYDRFHSNVEEIHQVWINAYFVGSTTTFNALPYPALEELRNEHPGIKRVVMNDFGSPNLLSNNQIRFNKKGIYATDEFLEMFQFPMVAGSPTTSLDDPTSIVLTESTAKALFGSEDPVNKTVRLNNTDDLKVTGVLKNLPSNSTYQFDYIIPFSFFENQWWVRNSKTRWDNYVFQMFVELHPDSRPENVEAKIKDLLTRHGQTDVRRELFLHPMTKWRMFSNFQDGKVAGGMIDYVRLFSIVAVFILVIACINFMNLATARSERRAREVGIRKTVGSKRKDLIFQFLGESILISIIAFLISLVITESTLPFYNTLVNKNLFIDYTSYYFWGFASAIVLFTGALAGSYPAFYLSSFNAVKVLKGTIGVGRSASTPRKALVILQFAFSIVLIVCSIVIQFQIEHVRDRAIGYNKENLITINQTNEIAKNYHAIKNDLLSSGKVEAVTKSNSPITAIYAQNWMDWPGKPADEKVTFTSVATEYDYSKTMGMKMLQGRDFSEDFKSDTSAIIINQAALDVMGLENPIGTTVRVWDNDRHIIGVVDNVLMGSVFSDVTPGFIVFIPDWFSAVTIRLKDGDIQASIKVVEEIMKKHNPSYPFEYTFVDDEFDKKFSTINMLSNLGYVFTILAIGITGLGLFGLAAFTAERRTKEIGIRKVLGASVSNLILLLTSEFSALVFIAFLLAGPAAWWGATTLLEKYPYRIALPTWVYPIAGVLCLLFAVLIVSTQAFKAASSNPVESLRNE